MVKINGRFVFQVKKQVLGHIKSLVPTGVEGVITGRALYTGNIELPEAIKAGKGEI